MNFKDINRWNVWKMPNDIIPSFNSISDETIHLHPGLASYFVKVIKGLRRRRSLFWR